MNLARSKKIPEADVEEPGNRSTYVREATHSNQ
jgi:hypothetical protein